MKHSWLHKKDAKKLILFFGGWSCDEQAFKTIPSEDYDVVMLYDYSNLTFPLEVENAMDNYSEVSLLAWSFGVWVAQIALYPLKDRLKNTVAINGTLHPVDRSYGIPTPIALGTLSGLSDKNLKKFHRRMFSNRDDWSRFEAAYPLRAFDEVKNELFLLFEHFKVQKPKHDFYQTAIISKEDLIFSAVNQTNYWQGKAKLIEMQQGHFCFYVFQDWKEIIGLK
ncbi:MAG: DUF452 family protein [Carboxylicivirga sp.]|jgi:biotin synthesis protein BioG|nr:DUF452 family protein [Carboxylicivirga sp.]